jgi:hypothetical protein
MSLLRKIKPVTRKDAALSPNLLESNGKIERNQHNVMIPARVQTRQASA